MKLSKIYSSLILESIIGEARVEYNDLPPSTILVSNDNLLTLYDSAYYKSEDPSNGVLGFIAIGCGKGYCEVELVGAKKGVGPLMYELGMQYVSSMPLVSSREGDTKEGALRVWSYFLNGHNSDVTVTTLSPDDEGYIDCLDWGCDDENPEFFKIYNSRFTMEETSEYMMLMEDADEFYEKVGGKARGIITQLGREFFDSVY